MTTDNPEPIIRTAGYDGFLISFGETLSEPANRAAIAYRAAVECANWPGVVETTTSLVSAYLRFEATRFSHDEMRGRLEALLTQSDWYQASWPEGRKFWRVPAVYGTDLAPQLDEAAAMAGLSGKEAVDSLSQMRVRVQTIGFAPGQPYLGSLSPEWNIPRQTALTDRVPVGALTLAIRQFVLFSVSAPTGWRHVGQTALKLFQPDMDDPFMFRPGDEVVFESVSAEHLARCDDRYGGARFELIR